MAKTKIVGKQRLVNPATGEVVDVALVSVEARDKEFHKLWLGNLFMTLDVIGNQKMRVCYWLIENANPDNIVIATYREIALETKISERTVAETIRLLIRANFLRRKGNGVYLINPDIVFQGSREKRINILYQYNRLEQEKEQDQDQYNRLEQEKEQDQDNVTSIFSQYGIDLVTAPEVILELKKYCNKEIEKIASVLAEMVKNGDITNPVGFLRKDKEWKIKQILEGKIKPNKKEKTTPKKRWFHQEYELYDPLKN